MAFVIDASVAAVWLLPDDEVLVPGLFWLEMRNILLVCERRGRVDSASADRALGLVLVGAS
ncbi:type II toxin-antitoxin system VapC family toxin [Pseudazoarcus pumilus]|uniref:PIN domain-containing protein n=1 Tax=Pseudazoarcus pumilus TaxID=2067960 RepID=A0A2I6S7Y4_9RHOO|nr:type II toxin-antitoxin system VapC family toxin [Pseudazoarcus pumilus]AUN95376.1 hypothetical protein C0099_10825 [Pseudazoarcus pumilus]